MIATELTVPQVTDLPFEIVRLQDGNGFTETRIRVRHDGFVFDMTDATRPAIVKAVLDLVDMYAAQKETIAALTARVAELEGQHREQQEAAKQPKRK